MLDLRTSKLIIDGETGRRLLMIANELITNAFRHALVDRIGRVVVSLSVEATDVTMTVSDDGPGIDPDAPARGTPIVRELVHRAGGRILRESGSGGTALRSPCRSIRG